MMDRLFVWLLAEYGPYLYILAVIIIVFFLVGYRQTLKLFGRQINTFLLI